MDVATGPFVRRLALIMCALSLSACELPRAGPDPEEIVAGSKAEGGELNVVLVDSAVARLSEPESELGFSGAFLGASASATDMINPGDTLSVTVWENVDNGLLASVGQKVTVLEEIQVDQRGRIFVPYAGSLVASGKTPEQLRLLITRNLDTQTPDPQVEVRRLAGDGSSVSIIGGVGAQGVYPIEPSTTNLASMLARAGGVTIDADVAQIAIRRGSATGRIFLQDLYDDPRMDVALRSNDTIIVEEDRRTFTALGATGQQARVPFPRGRISVIEAIAEVGGLDGNTSDPTGVFVFRRERAHIADRVMGRTGHAEGEPFVYVIDLTKPSGMFVARDFHVRDEDTIYVTEAPFVAWAKVLEATSGTLSFATSAAALANALDNN